jgi:hypothetical protein
MTGYTMEGHPSVFSVVSRANTLKKELASYFFLICKVKTKI